MVGRVGQASSMEPIARLTAVVLDCPDPHKLAAFYGEITGWTVEYDSEPEWVTLRSPNGLRLCFQVAPEHVPPVWPDPTAPQQAHLDFSVLDGNDLITPHPEWGFPGLQPGDKWCVCVTRWKSALDHNRAAPVDLEATHASALEFVTLEELKAHAIKKT